MKIVKDPYETIRQLYEVIGKDLPDEERFCLSGVTITVDGDGVTVTERGRNLVIEEEAEDEQ